jgi:hypothetical protein
VGHLVPPKRHNRVTLTHGLKARSLLSVSCQYPLRQYVVFQFITNVLICTHRQSPGTNTGGMNGQGAARAPGAGHRTKTATINRDTPQWVGCVTPQDRKVSKYHLLMLNNPAVPKASTKPTGSPCHQYECTRGRTLLNLSTEIYGTVNVRAYVELQRKRCYQVPVYLTYHVRCRLNSSFLHIKVE